MKYNIATFFGSDDTSYLAEVYDHDEKVVYVTNRLDSMRHAIEKALAHIAMLNTPRGEAMEKPDYVLNAPEQAIVQETINLCDRLADHYLDTDLGDSMARTSIALQALQMDTDICPNTYDVVGFISAYESDQLNADQVAIGFQHLINSGLVWELQGSYGRRAASLIQEGHCKDTHGVLS